jgi:hypothetical protein
MQVLPGLGTSAGGRIALDRLDDQHDDYPGQEKPDEPAQRQGSGNS